MQEFFMRFPTLLGLQGTAEIKSGLPIAPNFREDFVINYFPHAQKAGKTFGVNPVVILAQAAVESAWGRSNLSRNYNNFFGITAYGDKNEYWKGEKYISGSSGLPFRVYATPGDGFSDFARLIASRYAEAARSSPNVVEYAKKIAYSPYVNEKNGDNRETYRALIINNAQVIYDTVKKNFQLQ